LKRIGYKEQPQINAQSFNAQSSTLKVSTISTMSTPMDLDVATKKRKQDDEAEMPPTKVFIVEAVPMEIDEPVNYVFNLFPVPRLVRSVNSS